ncbi:hypothetical protein VMCG_05959 [Cytospora schulzeri]|uniref:Ubiquitin-like domain-containing protein n=1 Tax=Cytospora schulzeri TaxID=448051 RepID=A0A423WCX3_9PEZI|nr:hypothetical protein VMCG_05959 [Valsa malicola]
MGTAVDGQEASKNENSVVKPDPETTQVDQNQQKPIREGTAESTQTEVALIGKPAQTSFSFSPSAHLNLKFPSLRSDWIQSIFGKDDKFKKDWESEILEAYTLQTYSGYRTNFPITPIKVPFGHRRLHYGLEKVVKDKEKLGSTWDRYIALGTRVQSIIRQVVFEVNQRQNCKRVCVAFQEYNTGDDDPFMLVFFSILKEKPPVVFKDVLGRTYKIPFETCRKWSRFAITEEEDKQLMFIDFVEELEKAKNVTIDDLLAEFTTLRDVVSEGCLKDIFTDDSDYESDDSGTSSASSTSYVSD